MSRLIVIGGDAAGMSGASQARRANPDLEIIVFERTGWVSYAACGVPYFVGGDVAELRQLQARTPEQFARMNIDVRLHHEVIAIDTTGRTVTVRTPAGTLEQHEFDTLLYATGSRGFLAASIAGLDMDGVHQIRTLDDAQRVRTEMERGPRHSVVVGGGYIGLEAAEALQNLDIPVRIFEMTPHLLPRTIDAEMAEVIDQQVAGFGIDVHTSTTVDRVIGDKGHVIAVEAGGERYPADIVILGMGSLPNSDLAAQSGIALGPTGAVAVDDHQRTSIEGVYAAGDCAEATHRVSGKPANFHLGTVANKQGRIAGTNIGGGDAAFPGVLGTAITKVHDLEISRTGLTEAEATGAGFDAVAAMLRSSTGAHYWPGSRPMRIRMIAERGSGRLLGAQIVGGPGAGKRIDTFATALWNGMTADELEYVDLSYSPPFSGVWEPANVAARKVGRAAGQA